VAQTLFRQLRNHKTKTQIAIEIAQDTIEEYRIERMAVGSDAPESEHTRELLMRLRALLKGPHKAAVKPVIERAFPVLAAPQGQA